MRISELDIKDEHDSISQESTLTEAAKKVLNLKSGVLVILDGETPVGILTDYHLLLSMSKGLNCAEEKCLNHMDSNILSVTSDSKVKDVMLDMHTKKPVAVVVVDEGKLSGYFSPQDYRTAISSITSKPSL